MEQHRQQWHSQPGTPMAGIDAPYNFVRLSRWIFSPSWQNLVSQDLPFKDGISGSLPFTLTAHTPLLVGGSHGEGDPVHFFTLPDASGRPKPAIPGSSLRGMIRNVLEIAAFGKLSGVEDRRLGVRDLTAGARPFYGDVMSRSGANQTYEPKVKAGWLGYDSANAEWRISPCEFARIEQRDLQTYAGISFAGRPAAAEKYQQWTARKPLAVKFTAENPKDHPHSKGKRLRYRKAVDLGKGATEGTLVFTGQPGPNKHMEFIFFDSSKKPSLPIHEKVWRGFLDIHQDTPEWKYWKNTLKADKIPVFYLDHGGIVESLGLAMMYKLAYKHSLRETIEHTNKHHLSTDFFDLAELIFGAIRDDTQSSLKGRASFSHARCVGQFKYLSPTNTILNSPKPTYYPNYVRQNADPETWKIKDGYKTYSDGKAEIRGWKRYPVRPQARPQALTPDQEKNKSVQVQLNPLDAGASFSGQLSFHNLKPEELGALVWALTWGEYAPDSPLGHAPRYRHALGMGKSFGYGQVSFSLGQPQLTPNLAANAITLEACVQRFIACLDDAYTAAQNQTAGRQNWVESEQVRQLLAMADPGAARLFPGRLRHMTIERPNEFVAAKSRDNAFALPEYTRHTGPDEASLFPEPVVSGFGGLDDNDSPHKPLSTNPQALAWVEQTIAALMAKHHAKPEDILKGKGLAEAWQNISDESLKLAARDIIEARWHAQGWWDSPRGSKTIQARAIYGG